MKSRMMSIEPRNEPEMLRWFHETYPSYDLQPLLLKRYRGLDQARAFNKWLANRRLAQEGQRRLDDVSRRCQVPQLRYSRAERRGVERAVGEIEACNSVAMTGRSGERQRGGVQRGRGPAVSRREAAQNCGPAGRLWGGCGPAMKAGQACGGSQWSGGGVDIALASGEVGNGLAERQWSQVRLWEAARQWPGCGNVVKGRPGCGAVARLHVCLASVPRRVRLGSVPLESVRGGVCQGSVPATRVTEECCVLGECLRVCLVPAGSVPGECARGVCQGSAVGECARGVRWGSVPGECARRVRLRSVPLESVRGGVCQGSVPVQE